MKEPCPNRPAHRAGPGQRRQPWFRVRSIGALGLGCLLALIPLGARSAATPAELDAYQKTLRFFQTAAYDLAEREFLAFLEAYPQSEKAAEIRLLVGQCRFQQRNFEGALAGLREGLAGAGGLADQYRFWTAEALFQLGQLDAAAAEYDALLKDFPASERRLDAVVGAGYARFRAGNAREAFDLLARPDGVFLALGPGRAGNELAARGFLLLGEVALACGEPAAGEQLLGRLPADGLRPELAWQRQYLLARLQSGAGKPDAALQTATNLLATVTALTNATAVATRADAAALVGGLLEQQRDWAGAIQAFEGNLGASVPAARRTEAAQQVGRLVVGHLPGDPGLELLDRILARHVGDAVVDPLQVAWADLQLQRYFGLPEDQRAAALERLQLVRRRLTAVLVNPAGAWSAQAQFDLGWSWWEERRLKGAGEGWSEALGAFRAAADQLPRSPEQAIARFKTGDCHFALTNYAAAVPAYWLAATNYADLPEVRQALADHALYQVVRAGIASGDLETARGAMRLILEWFPESYFGDRSVLLFGQAQSRQGQPADARKLFEDFLAKDPLSPLAPQLGLAMARTWQQEGQWAAAAGAFAAWVSVHTNHPARPQAEYEQAWSTARSGAESQAFEQFRAFLDHHPNDPLVPSARYWIGDAYYRQEKYDLAESEYQRIFQDTRWPPSRLSLQARLMAGHCAYKRTNYKDARTYFADLINTNPPPELQIAAYFALGDTIRQGADAAGTLAALDQAIVAYSWIPNNHPASPEAPLAWREIGNCRYQLGTADSTQYDLAVVAYTNVLTAAQADVATRSQAEVGMGHALKAKAEKIGGAERAQLLTEALGHYLAVTGGKNLRAGESADLLWVERAGLAGAQLAEELQRWEVAERLYQQLIELLPSQRQRYELRLDRVRKAREAAAPAG